MELVDHGNPNCCNADGLTPLMMAAAGGHMEVVRLLVTSAAKVNAAPNACCISPLSLAGAQNGLEVVRLLLQWRGDPNVAAWFGNAPLTRAAAAGHVQVAALLLEHAADPDAYDSEGVTATMQAVEHVRLEATQLLLRSGASVARADNRSCSALSRAVDVLLRMDAMGKVMGGIRSPLSEYDFWTEMCSIMVERKADVNIVDKQGDTLLARAVRSRRKDVLVTLLSLGADRDFPVPSLAGGAVLAQAVSLGERDLCEALINRAASVNQPLANGVTPLCLAIDTLDENLCFYLLQSGAQYRLRDPRTGEELVMRAAANGLRRLYDSLRPSVPVDAVGPGRASDHAAEDGVEYEQA